MQEAAIRFARAARNADVALFYFAGHAMQFAGVNYLMPVDVRLTDEADVRRLVRADDIVADLQGAKNLRILVLDSCRNNPLAENFKRSIGRSRAAMVQNGLAKIDSPEGTVVAFATQAGRTADDGEARNSPYTTAFLKHIATAEEIGTVFRRISADVYNATRRAQLPELSLSMIGEFFLRGLPAAPDQPKPQAVAVPVLPPSPISQSKADEPGSFDGPWRFQRMSSNCRQKTFQFPVIVSKGTLTGSTRAGKITGTVSSAGQTTFSHLGTDGSGQPDGKTVSYSGRLIGNSGQGTFYKGKNCSGIFSAARF